MWWGIIFKAIIGAVKGIFGIVTGSKDPSPVELAASNAKAQVELTQEREINETLQDAAIARTSAVAAVVRDVTSPGDNINDTLKRDFPQDFRN